MILLRNKIFSKKKEGFIISDRDIWRKHEKSDFKKLTPKQLKAISDYGKTSNTDSDARKGKIAGGLLMGTMTAVPGAAIGGLIGKGKGAALGGITGGALGYASMSRQIGKEHRFRKDMAEKAKEELERRNKGKKK